jgi:hypothetical protein
MYSFIFIKQQSDPPKLFYKDIHKIYNKNNNNNNNKIGGFCFEIIKKMKKKKDL